MLTTEILYKIEGLLPNLKQFIQKRTGLRIHYHGLKPMGAFIISPEPVLRYYNCIKKAQGQGL